MKIHRNDVRAAAAARDLAAGASIRATAAAHGYADRRTAKRAVARAASRQLPAGEAKRYTRDQLAAARDWFAGHPQDAASYLAAQPAVKVVLLARVIQQAASTATVPKAKAAPKKQAASKVDAYFSGGGRPVKSVKAAMKKQAAPARRAVKR